MEKVVGDVAVPASVPTKLNQSGMFGRFLLADVKTVAGTKATDSNAMVDSVRSALQVANDLVGPIMIGTFTAPTSKGIAVVVYDNADPASQRAWLDEFAGELGRLGLTGRLRQTATWRAGIDDLQVANRATTYPTSFVGYRMSSYHDLQTVGLGWQVDAATTQRVASGVENWMDVPGTETWPIVFGSSVPIPHQAVAAFMSATASISQWGDVINCVSADRTECRHAAREGMGKLVTQRVDRDRAWDTLVEEQISLLLIDPIAADMGLIKNVYGVMGGWSSIEVKGKYQHRPVRLSNDYDRNRHLWDEYLIDAAGVCLLTSKHLEHASDLTNWSVKEIAPDRYLVQANDLAAWYSPTVPDPAVIEQARADFGDMILTWETILANPGPYTITDPRIVGR